MTAPALNRIEVIETNLPMSPILNPRIYFRNTSTTDPVRIIITQVLNLGVSSDLLLSGTFPTVMVNQLLLPGEELWHLFAVTFLGEGLIFHTVELDVSAISADVILQMWVEGQFEESLGVLPTFVPIII